MPVNLVQGYNLQMPSIWVRWRSWEGEYFEITINDVLGDATRSWDSNPREAREEQHGERKYLVNTRWGPIILCKKCCRKIGLPT